MKEFFSNYKRVLQTSKKGKKYFLRELIFSLINLAIGIVIPLFVAKQIVYLSSGNQLNELLYMSIAIFIIGLVKETNWYLLGITCRKVRLNIISEIKMKSSKNILELSEKTIHESGSGTFIDRLTKDTENMADMYTHGTGYIANTIANLGIFVTLFVINKIVCLYYIFTSIVLTLVHLIRNKKVKKLDIIKRTYGDKVSSLVNELIRGEKDLKLLYSKEAFLNSMNDEIKISMEKDYNCRFTDLFYAYLINILSVLFVLILIFLLIWLIKTEQLTAALAVVLFTYRTNVMTNFMENISLLLDEVRVFNTSCKRVFDLIDYKQFEKERFGNKEIENINGTFEFRKVNFAYDKEIVIKDLSFKINSGETVAFVGKSGSGKSTIFNLLGKLYDIKDGNIYIDGIDINELDEKSIRGNITIITQNPYIFNMSIRDNFKLIKENITDDEIMNALKVACVDEYVNSLENKLDTIVGENGTILSGGQKQRLAIARAFVQNTKIILFDESTSALDNETQKNIQNAIDNLKGKYTILIIAHRLSTIKNSDKIFVIEDGKTVGEGSHQYLLKNNKTYKKLYESENIEK